MIPLGRIFVLIRRRDVNVFYFLFFFTGFLSAQEPDSLLNEYGSYPNDTVKVDLLYNKGYALRNKDLGSAIKFSQACYQTAILAKDHRFLAKALNFRAILKAQTGLNKEAVVDFERVLFLRIQTKDTLAQIQVLNNLGNTYDNLNESDKAFDRYESSLKLARQINAGAWTRAALLGIASLQLKLKSYAQAAGNFKTVLEFDNDENKYEIISICYLNLSLCELYLGDTLAAEAYGLLAVDELGMMDDELGLSEAYANLSEISLAKGDRQESFSFLQRAFEIAKRNDYSEGLIAVWKRYSIYYASLKDLKKEEFYLAKHDSAVSANRLNVAGDQSIWEKNKFEYENAEASLFSTKRIFLVMLIGIVIVLLLLALKGMQNEQKG